MTNEAAVGGFKYQTAGASVAKTVGKGVKAAEKGVGSIFKGAKGVGKGAWGAVDKTANTAVKYVVGGKLTTQGTVALVCYAVMLVTAAVSPVVAAQIGTAKGGIAALAGVLISAVISVYGINCMVVGGCKRLSWVYVAVLLFWTVSVVAGTAYFRYFMGNAASGTERMASGEDTRLLPDPLADAPISLVAPQLQRPGQPAIASPDEIAAGTNVIFETQKANLYEGYDAQGAEQDAPGPYVEGEHASA
jgi:hypothetical protein